MKRKLLEAYITSNPINFIMISYIYLAIYLFFPFSVFVHLFEDKIQALGIVKTTLRFFFVIIPLALYFLSTKNIVCERTKYKKLIYTIPIAIVCLNNIPFFSLAREESFLFFTPKTLSHYFLDCLSVGILEETIFRGIIFPLYISKFHSQQNGMIKSIIYSSALFGLTHLINLLSGASILMTLFQVGYSFLMGCAFALAYFISENLLVPIILHTIYNFGGMLIDYGYIYGNVWTIEQLFMTALIGIVVGIYCFQWILKIHKIYYWENE